MTPKFLREEAARFRGMAETSDREASKARFLAMAIDFEARADAGDANVAPIPDAAIESPDTAIEIPATAIEPRVGRRIGRVSKDAV